MEGSMIIEMPITRTSGPHAKSNEWVNCDQVSFCLMFCNVRGMKTINRNRNSPNSSNNLLNQGWSRKNIFIMYNIGLDFSNLYDYSAGSGTVCCFDYKLSLDSFIIYVFYSTFSLFLFIIVVSYSWNSWYNTPNKSPYRYGLHLPHGI